MAEPNFATEKSKRDYQLVCAAREQGDERAYAELMGRYRDSLYQMLFKMTGDADEADDLTIETFGKAFCQLHLYSPTNAFSTWLFSIGSNSCIDRIRRRHLPTVPLSSLASRDEDDHYELPMPSSSPNPEEEIIASQRVKRVREVVSMLKPSYRTVIELRYFEELSYEEIAQRLSLPMGTVKVHLLRARQLLDAIIKSQSEPL
ncbi:MAG: sigma-70 family RNA polymerase sigma factor [Bacteroidales bacterium]|nr:sigma-70 family RNA polymerase sigma factor [Bacteroidales bacterium]